MISRNISLASSRDFPACLLKYVTMGCRRNKDIYIHSIYWLVINERFKKKKLSVAHSPVSSRRVRADASGPEGRAPSASWWSWETVICPPQTSPCKSALPAGKPLQESICGSHAGTLGAPEEEFMKMEEAKMCDNVFESEPEWHRLSIERDFHLEVMENRVGHGIFAWNGVGPQFLHVKHLIGQWRHYAYRMNRSINSLATSHVFTLKILIIFMKNKQSPSFTALAFLIQSVRCRTKSKKKSPSGTLITWNVLTRYW